MCYNCNHEEHYSNECPEPKKSSSNKKVHYVCDGGTVDNDASKTKSNATPRNLNRFNQNNIYADLIHSTQKNDHLLVMYRMYGERSLSQCETGEVTISTY